MLSRSAAPYPCTDMWLSRLLLMRYSQSSRVSLTLILLPRVMARYPLSFQLQTVCLETPRARANSERLQSSRRVERCAIFCMRASLLATRGVASCRISLIVIALRFSLVTSLFAYSFRVRMSMGMLSMFSFMATSAFRFQIVSWRWPLSFLRCRCMDAWLYSLSGRSISLRLEEGCRLRGRSI